jgi:hypothetical protein
MIAVAVTSAAAAISFSSCVRTVAPQQQQHSPAPSPSPSATEAGKDDLRRITYEKPRLQVLINEWWPVEVIGAEVVETGPRRGDWIIEIRNVSDRAVKAAQFILDAPYQCDAFVMPSTLDIGLGENNPYYTRPANPTLAQGEIDKIVVPRKSIGELIPPKELATCPPEKSYCFLYLKRVWFADGSKWVMKHDPDDPNWEN